MESPKPTTLKPTTLYICPVCDSFSPAWVSYSSRNRHMQREHPGYPFPKGKDPNTPNGQGSKEWHKLWDAYLDDGEGSPPPKNLIGHDLPVLPRLPRNTE